MTLRLRPERLKRGGVEGHVAAHCRAQRSGELGARAIIKEAPQRSGFGVAALKLAPKFRVDLSVGARLFRTTLWVDVPIRFALPGRASAG
jgi:hypothetical protein